MMDDSSTLSVSDAADYLGISVQTLRRWDASGKLKPVRHPASNYRYYRLADLEPFRTMLVPNPQMNAEIAKFFEATPANIEGNDNLREPQQEAHRHARKHFATSSDPAILQIPVGCG